MNKNIYKKNNCKNFELKNVVVLQHLIFKSVIEVSKKLESEDKKFRIAISSDDLKDYFFVKLEKHYIKKGCTDKSDEVIYSKTCIEVDKIRKMIRDYTDDDDNQKKLGGKKINDTKKRL